jgi:hypothetical protein
MIKSVRAIGYKLAGEDPAPPPDKASKPVVIRIDIRWDRGRGKREELEPQEFGDGIII